MRPNDSDGFLFTFCGLDGCGKTTMLTKLEEELGGKYEIFKTKQPTNAVRKSDIFRTYMDNPNHDAYDYRSLSLLAASDRLQHVNKVIKPQMIKGKIVISDRYFYSCLANLRARGFMKDKWIYEIAESVIIDDNVVIEKSYLEKLAAELESNGVSIYKQGLKLIEKRELHQKIKEFVKLIL